MKKKLVLLIMTTILCFGVTACGKDKDDPSSDTVNTQSKEEASNDITENFEDNKEEDNDESNTDTNENPFGSTADINEYISTKEIDPPLWKVTDPESGNTMYMLGTIHLLPSDVSEYPADLMDIYNNCECIAVEYDVTALLSDMKLQIEYANGMLYTDGTKIQNHISEETYNKAKDYFTSIGAYSKMLDMYTAGYWINQLSTVMYYRLDNVEMTGTDVYFLEKAHKDGKEVINIEDLSIQTSALNAYTDDYAEYSINDLLDNMDDIEGFAEAYSELYESWANGDGEIGMDSDLSDFPEELLDDYEIYMDILLDDRNQNMAQKAAQYIKEGKNCLFMVGAAHYSGENGVDNLLENMGFVVEKVE